MTKREVVREVLEGRRPPYVPWSFSFTREARARLAGHYGVADLDEVLGNHLLELGGPGGTFVEDLGGNRFRDPFGVVWNRSLDKNLGFVEGTVLPEPTLRGYAFPDPRDERLFRNIPGQIARGGDRFRVFPIGFSLYERAWTMRGMENLMCDFLENPGFVRELLRAIADHNLGRIERALSYDIDAVYLSDDWGQQRGLQMGPALWREFIHPEVTRLYGAVRAAGKYVFIHSCGDVDELFDDLIAAGLNCFNPFQPEVMDIEDLFLRYRGRLAFHGGLSTQQTLPHGSAADVRAESRRLLDLGREGGYIFAPAHAVQGDVPLENMLAFIEEAQSRAGILEGGHP